MMEPFVLLNASFDMLMIRIQLLVNEISQWLLQNRLFPNTSKTYLMFFNYNNTSPPLPDVFFGSDTLTWVKNFKYLGMVIDNKLTFKLHVSHVQSKISRGVGILHRLSSFCGRDILVKLYYSLIYSHVIQNVIIWGVFPTTK